ncbi:hypothetical protein AAD018_004490 [Aestuariibius insulae]|uniref:hypothetical protein n=1 Tax=Aestuariibius insulae TaxID=2058287 RepID=UPI00345E1D42
MSYELDDRPNNQVAAPGDSNALNKSNEPLEKLYSTLMKERDKLAIRNDELKATNIDQRRTIEELKRITSRTLKLERKSNNSSIDAQHAAEYTRSVIKSSTRWKVGNFLVNLVQAPAKLLKHLLQRNP